MYFCHDNEYYKEEVPKQVKILEPDRATQLALSSGRYVLQHIFDIQHWPLVLLRLWSAFGGKCKPANYFARRNADWKKKSKFVSRLKKKYNAAIAFLGTNAAYYTLDKISAEKYIVWQRTDYKLTGCNPELDRPYFNKADTVCVLSDEMKNNFLTVFPELYESVVVFPNLYDLQEMFHK